MRAEQLKLALLEIKGLFTAAGVAAVEKDMDTIADYVGRDGSRNVDQLISEIRAKLDPSVSKAVRIAQHVASLKEAGLQEQSFHAAIDGLRMDKSMDKTDVLKVLQAFGVIRINGKSRESYIESLDKHFYWLLYNRDADAMAQRATPW
jgi:hypothetical protein